MSTDVGSKITLEFGATEIDFEVPNEIGRGIVELTFRQGRIRVVIPVSQTNILHLAHMATGVAPWNAVLGEHYDYRLHLTPHDDWSCRLIITSDAAAGALIGQLNLSYRQRLEFVAALIEMARQVAEG